MSVDAVKAVRGLRERDLTYAERALLFALAEESRSDCIASPGCDELAKEFETSESQIRNLTSALCNPDRRGGPLLRKVGGGYKGRRAEYKLLFVPAKASARTDPLDGEGSGSTDAIAPAAEPAPPQNPHAAESVPARVSKGSLKGQPGLTPSVTTVSSEELLRTASADADDAIGDDRDKLAAEELFADVFEDNQQRTLADAIRWAIEYDAKHPYAYVLGAWRRACARGMDEFEALRRLAEAHDWGLTDDGAA